MEILVGIFIVWLAFVVISGVVSWISDTIRYKQLARAHSADLASMVAQIESVRLSEIKDKMEEIKRHGRKSLGVLTAPDGAPLNICPRCGGTLRVGPQWRAATLSCANFRCAFTCSLPDKPDQFPLLRVT